MINSLFQKLTSTVMRRPNHMPLSEELKHVFEKFGEGIYLINIKSEPGLFGTLVGLFNANYSHTVLVYYHPDLAQQFDYTQWKKVIASLRKYYHDARTYMIKALVLSNATASGIVCCDLSVYNDRTMTIRRLPMTTAQQRMVVSYMVDRIGYPYDVTGLMGWLFKKWNDPDAYFCSEICYNACICAGFSIAEGPNPSPLEIELYCSVADHTWDKYIYRGMS